MEEQEFRERFGREAEHVRLSGVLGKSVQIGRLFEFLVERSLVGSSPKEIEIAREVFGFSHDANVGLDATVRANVHRLRKKLESVPAGRLTLPRGEYRLILTDEQEAPPTTLPAVGDDGPPAAPRRRWRMLPYAMALGLLAIVAIGLVWRAEAPAADKRLATPFWRSLASAPFPTLLVSGDHYIFGEIDGNQHVVRMIRDPAVNSRQQLDRYKAQTAGAGRQFIDMNYSDLPEGLARALPTIAPIVAAATATASADRAGGGIGYAPLTTSRFTTDMLGGHNIVYVGLLGDLRDLHDPLFEQSGFILTAGADALVDRRSGRRYQSDWADPSEERIMRRDYAYVASMQGPSGTRLLVIAGTRDPGMIEAAQIVSNPAMLDALASRQGAVDFEALYEVRTFGPSNVVSHLIVARAVRIGEGKPGK